MTSERSIPLILLVEDDPLLGTTMRRYLGRWSDDVRVAETCAEAVAAWTAMGAGVVMMDYRLPDGFGTDVIAKMREKGRTDAVICMTGESEAIPAEMQQALGIQKVLGKPVRLDDLRPELDGLGGAAVRSAAAPAKGKPLRPYGKFRPLCWRGPLTGARVDRLCKAAKNELWVALDMTGAGAAEPTAWRRLCAWSGWLSGTGGRLCLIVRDPAKKNLFASEIGAYVDVLADTAILEAQAARLTGATERRQLLDLVAASARRVKAHG